MAVALDRSVFLETRPAVCNGMAERGDRFWVGANQTNLVVFVKGDTAYSGERGRMKRG